ncbi:hypothetical protein [Rhodoplanes elegans]|uniref:hypothetical protein n=1 Tax=Rhodoplanes elegans TaxID=29408 RepID=UPI001472E2B7|nr:hypothetical protein [Rhodoplanes elegans]
MLATTFRWSTILVTALAVAVAMTSPDADIPSFLSGAGAGWLSLLILSSKM